MTTLKVDDGILQASTVATVQTSGNVIVPKTGKPVKACPLDLIINHLVRQIARNRHEHRHKQQKQKHSQWTVNPLLQTRLQLVNRQLRRTR